MNFPLPPGATGDVALDAHRRGGRPGRRALRAHVGAGVGRVRRPPRRPARRPRVDRGRLRRASTARVLAFAPAPGRLVAFLEGGYDLDALRASVAATVAPSPA